MYNVEKYLAQCVDSILSQTYPNIELILVDDGSTDSSPAMCDDFARNDERVRVIHHSVNIGLGAARNSGLDAARGELISIVDSDDYISPDMYEKLYSILRDNDADMSMCGLFIVRGEKVSECDNPNTDETITGMEALHRLLFPGHSGGYLVSWNKLYKSELFTGLRYPPATRHDDSARLHRLFGRSRKVALIPEALYYHRFHKDSIMGRIWQKDFDASIHMKNFVDSAEALRDLTEYLSSIGMNELCEFVRLRGIYSLVLSMLKRLNCIQYRREIREISGYSPLGLCAKLLVSGKLRFMIRGIKLFLWWIKSIMSPFTE